jgi:hypothetical protein
MIRLLLLAFLVVGCSTAAHEPTPRAIPDTAGVGSAPETVDTLSGIELAATVGGTATWCAPTPNHCQSWTPGKFLGAMESFRYGDRPYNVTVRHGGKAVVVTVVSHCACGNTLIDLSTSAFERLAPLSEGRIDVTVETGGRTVVVQGRPTLPPTSTE